MKFWRVRQGFVMSALVMALALSGCASVDSVPVDVKGLAGVWIGADGGRLEFTAGGRFTMANIPRDAVTFSFSEPPSGRGKISGSGTWKSVAKDFEIELYPEVGGSFSGDSETQLLMVSGGGSPQVLYFNTDPDKAYGYEIRKTP